MYNDEEFKAFLHVVHISDIHCRDGGAPTDLRAERFVQSLAAALRRASKVDMADSVEALWEQGLAGHDPDSHERMCKFLRQFANDSNFGGIETWLLDTGDISSMGDLSSINTAFQWLNDYQKTLNAKNLFFLYGNHDAWPAKFPLGSSFSNLHHHRTLIRQGLFPKKWPQGPLSITIPGTQSRLLLHGVNSVIDDRWHNTFARGMVDFDPHWLAPGSNPNQLTQLENDVKQGFNPDGNTRDFRILAVHHPVHYPPPRPKHKMSLRNDKVVADALINFDKLKRGKLAHLVLSGHTHETYPRFGELPRNAAGQLYQPLTNGQIQLIAGSLAQMPREANRNEFSTEDFNPHQFQILTFYAPPPQANSCSLLIERRVVVRPGGTGDYKYRVSSSHSPSVESIRIEY